MQLTRYNNQSQLSLWLLICLKSNSSIKLTLYIVLRIHTQKTSISETGHNSLNELGVFNDIHSKYTAAIYTDMQAVLQI